jgi:putative NIF3 family GTP cyclohydrolase 1 type 2
MSATRALLLLALSVLFGAPPIAAAPAPLTARQVVDRIKAKIGCERRFRDSVDTFKGGDPDTRVTGIVTTFAATFAVLGRAAASGKNLVITHEPTFYEHREDTGPIAGDPVLEAKRAFIRKHGLVVWRFHDQIHCGRPDAIYQGVIKAMGWQERRRAGPAATFNLPPTTVRALSRELEERLKARAVRVVGSLDLSVTKVALSAGASDAADQIRLLARDDVEVLVAGESREWETVEYARDAVAQGRKKALILLGHVPSEESGMEVAASWLRGFVTEVPIEFIPAGDPFTSMQ